MLNIFTLTVIGTQITKSVDGTIQLSSLLKFIENKIFSVDN